MPAEYTTIDFTFAYKAFGYHVTRARVEAGYTQEDFGALFGVSGSAVSRWELGKGAPGISNFLLVCNTLNLDPRTYFVLAI
jgi:transcriptional regulator with XRE-family HTH domain